MPQPSPESCQTDMCDTTLLIIPMWEINLKSKLGLYVQPVFRDNRYIKMRGVDRQQDI